MKKLILLIILALISSQNSFALNSSPDEMQYKKNKALSWYQAKGDESSKEILLIKNKAIRWYQKNITVFNNEINSSKKKAFRWYEKNSK